MLRNTQLILLTSFIFNLAACAKDNPASAKDNSINDNNPFNVALIASGLGIPWGMTFISENEILFTEKAGKVKILHVDSGNIRLVSGAPDTVERGQGGLMDVARYPAFGSSGLETKTPDDDDKPPRYWLYFTYTKALDNRLATALGRARLTAGQLVDWSELFVSNVHSSRGIHFGSRITFDEQGHVFVSLGERGRRNNAQDLSNHGGTVLRLNLDGSIPEDNPFIGQIDAMPEIWSYGHRNPQGLAYDSRTKTLWEIEHGPRGGDEINKVLPGRNYGWPVISYGKEYTLPKRVGEGTHKEGMEQPLKVYDPSIAPSSLLIYTGNAFKQWQGDLFAGALAMTHLNHVVLDKTGKVTAEYRYLNQSNERIRNVIQSPDGLLYLSTDSGKILRLSPK